MNLRLHPELMTKCNLKRNKSTPFISHTNRKGNQLRVWKTFGKTLGSLAALSLGSTALWWRLRNLYGQRFSWKAEGSCPPPGAALRCQPGFRSVGTGGIVNVRERDFWKYTQSKELRLLHPQSKIRAGRTMQLLTAASFCRQETEAEKDRDLLGLISLTRATLVFGDDRIGGSSCQERLRTMGLTLLEATKEWSNEGASGATALS